MDAYHATLKEEWNRRAIEDSRMLLQGALRKSDKAEKRVEEQTLEVKKLEDSNKDLRHR